MSRETLLSFLEDCLQRGTETALAYRRGLRISRWSYARLASTAFQFARELETHSICKGDRVLFWVGNSPEWVAAFFGCLLRGAIVVPLDRESAPEFVARVQRQVEAKLMLYSGRESYALLRALGSGKNLAGLSLEELSDRVRPRSPEPYPVENIAGDDIVEIIFTSGTTAEPKGVCLTHRNLLANLAPLEGEIQKYLKWERPVHPLRFLNLLPLSHVFGQFMGIFVPQLLGGEVFLQGSLNPSEILETVRKQRISVIVAVPRLLDALRHRIERDYEGRGQTEAFRQALASAEGWHFLKRWWVFRKVHRQFGWKFWAFVSGGAALSPETETFWRRLGFLVVQGYGMTESASLISVNHPFKVSRGSIGKPLPGREVKLAENGEILVRGENVSPGYWSGGVRSLTDEEGWLRTGDVGELDPAGHLYFKGRKKEVIVTAAGLNLYPEDLEAALKEQPEVRDSAVIGIEGSHGPEPLAVLLLRDEQMDPAAAVRRANERLSPYQQIRRWFVWPESDFPRTTTQKVRKSVVTEVVKASLSGDLPAREGLTPLAELIARIGGKTAAGLDPNASLAMDLKLDSLGRVELLSALEDRYQIDIDEAAFTEATTVGDIEKMIREGARNAASGREARPGAPTYPAWAQRFPGTWVRLAFLYLVIIPLTRLMGRPRGVGREHLREVETPALFVSNHITMVDAALILSALPGRFRRKLAIAMEGELLHSFRHPPEGTGRLKRLWLPVQYALIVSFFNVFPLPQKSGFRRSFAFAGETMDRGYNILVFPEGRRTQDGRMNPFMEGTGLLAKHLGAPVVPVKIEGLFQLKQRRQYFAKPAQISVKFGEPVRFPREYEPANITRDLERWVAAL